MGTRLTDFELGARLGGGSFGEVHSAYDRVQNARVALKRLRCVDVESLYRFKKEFRVLADLFHPNLVRLYELFTTGEEWYISMELVDGVDVVTYAREGVPLELSPTVTLDSSAWRSVEGSTEERLRLSFHQLAKAICALHDSQRLHRDLKPSNVLVTLDGVVKVLDFGLATELSNKGSSLTQAVGTPDYMAPEQAVGDPLTPAADWYAFGTMLYEALTSELPFEGPDVQAILQAKQAGVPREPRLAHRASAPPLYDLTMRLLAREPDARPEAHEILAVLAPTPQPPARISSPVPRKLLVGRTRESASLDEALARSSSGASVVVHLVGASGNGKTALLKDFVERVEARGDAVVLEGRCYEGEGVPFKAVDTVMDSVATRLALAPVDEIERILPRHFDSLGRLFPVLQRLAARVPPRPARHAYDPLEIRRRAFLALRELVSRVGDRRPVVVCIDDLQWGDRDSVALLADLVRPPDAPPMLLVLSFRKEAEGSDIIRELRASVRGEHASEVAVGPLTRADSAALAHALLDTAGTAAEKDVDAIAQESAGSPLFVHELTRHVLEGARSTADVSVDALLAQRVSRLDAPARELLEIVSVAARAVHSHVLRQVALVSGEVALGALAQLRSEHLVRTRKDADAEIVEAYHDRIRERVRELLDPSTARRWHRAIAGTLEALGETSDGEVLMTHWREAGDRERAAKYATVAADQATSILAFDRAARLYQLALSHSESNDDDNDRSDRSRFAERRALRLRLADALANAGRGALAAIEYQRAAEGATDAQALDLRRRAAEQLLRSGRFDQGLEALQAVLRSVGWRLPRSSFGTVAVLLVWRALVRVRGLRFRERDRSHVSPHDLTRIDICWSAAAALGLVDALRGALFQTRHLLFALRAGETYRVARAVTLEIAYSAAGGTRSWRRTSALIERSAVLSERARDPHARGMHLSASGLAHYLTGRFRQARTLFEQAESVFRNECVGAFYELTSLHQLMLQVLYYTGDVRELVRRRAVALREARDRGDIFALVNARAGYAAFVWLVSGDPVGGRADVDAAMSEWSKSGFHLEHYNALLAKSMLDLYAGDAVSAHGRVLREWPRVRRLLLLRIQGVVVDALACRSRTALALAEQRGADASLLRQAERDARRAERERAGWALPLARLLHAGVAQLRGQRDRARHQLLTAIEGFERAEMRLHELVAQRCLAEVTGERERRDVVEGKLRDLGFVDARRACGALAPGFGFASRAHGKQRASPIPPP